jgi:putative ABC transport system substrate-binding protein
MSDMKRREFITLLGGAAVAWPFAARAQQPGMPVIGFLGSASPDLFTERLRAFRQGLSDSGYVEGHNVTFEYRWAQGQYDRLSGMADDLVRRQVAVLVTGGGEPSALAAKAATATIPIVFVMGSDPVKAGLVATYNRPGGNITGINILTDTLEAKRLGLLHDLVPNATTIGFLANPHFASAESQLRDVEEAARGLALKIRVLHASTDPEIEATFAIVARERIPALLVGADPFFTSRRHQVAMLAISHAVPAIFEFREFAEVGGLMSYGIDPLDSYRQAAIYAGRILKGEKPANLPVLQPTKFQFVVNLKTANTLGFTMPPGLLAIADEVIE